MTPLRMRVARAIFAAGFHPEESSATITSKWQEWTEDADRALRQADAVLAIMADTEKMAAMLERCAGKFAFYAQNHRAKNTEDSLSKALVNEAMVAEIAAVLNTTAGTPGSHHGSG